MSAKCLNCSERTGFRCVECREAHCPRNCQKMHKCKPKEEPEPEPEPTEGKGMKTGTTIECINENHPSWRTHWVCTKCNKNVCWRFCSHRHDCKPEPESGFEDDAAEYLRRMMLDYSAYKGKHKELTVEHEELKGEFDALRKARDDLAENHDIVFANLEKLEKERDELVQKCDDLVKERDDLAWKRDDLAMQRDNLLKQCRILENKKCDRCLELEDANDELRRRICNVINLARKIVNE